MPRALEHLFERDHPDYDELDEEEEKERRRKRKERKQAKKKKAEMVGDAGGDEGGKPKKLIPKIDDKTPTSSILDL